MKLRTNLLAILAIFCVVLCACAVSATDDVTDHSSDLGSDDSQAVNDDIIIPPDYSHNETQNASDENPDAEAINDEMIAPPDASHNESAMMNSTGNASSHAADENIINSTAAYRMPATGNPIFALFAVSAVLGGACVIRRKI